MEQKYIYIVFTCTVCRMGKFIRIVTHDEYNHTSVALDAKPAVLYSFARHYKNAPFYGGFVRESMLRYLNGEREAYACVYAVPVSEEQYQSAKTFLNTVSEAPEEYIYNMMSAACAPLHKKVHFDKAFTCIEFAVYILDKFVKLDFIDGEKFYTIGELMELLKPYYLFKAPITRYMTNSGWLGDSFPEQKTLMTRMRLTLGTNKDLCARFIRSVRHDSVS